MKKYIDNKAVVTKKGVKDKLREWYINNFSVSIKDDKLRSVYKTSLDLQNTIGGSAVTIFAPYLLPIVPVAQKIAKGRLGVYDYIKSVIDSKIGVEIKDDATESDDLLKKDDLDKIGMISQNFFTNRAQAFDKNQEKGRKI